MDDHHLIANENSRYIEGECARPVTWEEIMLNVAHSNQVYGYKERYCVAFWFTLFFPVGILIIAMSLLSLLSVSFYGDFPLFLLLFTSGIFSAGFGYFFFLLLYLQYRTRQHVLYLSKLMVAAQRFTRGQVIKVTSYGHDLQEINYTFECSSDTAMVKGTHLTSLKHNLQVGDEVMVLYLDRNIHVLL